jgi:Family of unknown function (DUF6498)
MIMSQATAIRDPSAREVRDRLAHPSTLLLLATNAIPLFGVLFWHWDAMLMLLLYWAETGVIGFWAFASYLFRPGTDKDDKGRTGLRTAIGRLIQMAFLCLHAGVFMGAHLFILRDIFRDRWPKGVHGVWNFIDQVLIGSWLWIPLLAMFLFRGVMYLKTRIDPQTIRPVMPWLATFLVSLNGTAAPPTPAKLRNAAAEAMVRFYGRIILMQVALLFGGFLAIGFGNLVPAILLIVIKTTIDLLLHIGGDIRVEPVER